MVHLPSLHVSELARIIQALLGLHQVEDTPFGHLLVNYGPEDECDELDCLSQVTHNLAADLLTMYSSVPKRAR
jgi:hypothetical protein